MEISPLSVDLSELATEIAKEFGPTADRHRSRLEVRTPKRAAIAEADPDRVRQIIRILLDNALGHTPEGVKVTVATTQDNGRAELIVSDEGGPGIGARTQARIFERFYTGDSATGSGLGLAIAREFAERMEGRLGVVSSKGFTAFILELPLARQVPGPAPGEADAAQSGAPA
jgi:signal transduction histidine kinase